MAASRLKDVAARAGVSIAAASLALSGKGRISASVRESVRAAAQELDYHGVVRRDRPSPGVGMGILHSADRPYEWNFIRPTLLEIERAVCARGHVPVLLPVETGERPETALRRIVGSGVSALFAVQHADGELFDRLAERDIRIVVINKSGLQDRFPTVCVDDFQGAYEGTVSLLALGHRRLAFVEYERPESPNVVADRFVGFRKALEERGLAFPPGHRVTIPFMNVDRLGAQLAVLFRRAERPTAVFAHDDYLGLYVIEALGRLGLSVPGDVSLVAPGDVLDYGLPRMPQITTLRIDTALLGRIASSLMLESLERDTREIQVLKVKEQLVRRDTTRPCKGATP